MNTKIFKPLLLFRNLNDPDTTALDDFVIIQINEKFVSIMFYDNTNKEKAILKGIITLISLYPLNKEAKTTMDHQGSLLLASNNLNFGDDNVINLSLNLYINKEKKYLRLVNHNEKDPYYTEEVYIKDIEEIIKYLKKY